MHKHCYCVLRRVLSAAGILPLVAALAAHAATVTGNLVDISLQPLDTKMVFAPGPEVRPGSAGLTAGPAKVIQATAGAFTIVLDEGEYTVSLPLVSGRGPFRIAVPETGATVNLTNLIVFGSGTNTVVYRPMNLAAAETPVGAAGDWFWLASVGANRSGGLFSPEQIVLAGSADGLAWTRLVDGPVFVEPNGYTNNFGPIAREGAVQLCAGQFWMVYNFDPYNSGGPAQGLGLARSSDLTHWSRVTVLYPFGTTNTTGRMFAATWFTDGDGSNYLVGAYGQGALTAPKDCFIIQRRDDTFTNWSEARIILPSTTFKWDGALVKAGARYDLYYVNHDSAISRATNYNLTTTFQHDYDLDLASYALEAPQIIRLSETKLRMYGRGSDLMWWAESEDNGDTWPPEPAPLTGISWWHGPGIIRLQNSATNFVYSLGGSRGTVQVRTPVIEAGMVVAGDARIGNGLVAQDGLFLNHLRCTNVAADCLNLGFTNPAPAAPSTVKAWVQIVVGGIAYKVPLYQ